MTIDAIIDATPVLVTDLDGRIAAIPLGDLCPVCVEQPIEPDGDDRLCAKCRADFEKYREGWRDWGEAGQMNGGGSDFMDLKGE